MEKLFNPPEKKVDVRHLGEDSPVDVTMGSRLGERDYISHRKESFPMSHQPLKPLHHRSSRRKSGVAVTKNEDAHPVPDTPDGRTQTDGNQSVDETSSVTGRVPPRVKKKHDVRGGHVHIETTDEEEESLSEMSPLMDRGRVYDIHGNSNIPHIGNAECVKILMGNEEDSSAEVEHHEDEGYKHRRKHSGRHHHHHHHRHWDDEAEDPTSRIRIGSELGDGEHPHTMLPTEQEEADTLEGCDLDDLTSHRFEDALGLRRQRVHLHYLTQRPQKAFSDIKLRIKKMVDHSPHELFVELLELDSDPKALEWVEIARWIKFEEEVEEGSQRWGPPHVSCLSFHSLLNLRKMLETGVVLLDVNSNSFDLIITEVVNQMAKEDGIISTQEKPILTKILNLRRHHVMDHTWFGGTKRQSSSPQHYVDVMNGQIKISSPTLKTSNGASNGHHRVSFADDMKTGDGDHLTRLGSENAWSGGSGTKSSPSDTSTGKLKVKQSKSGSHDSIMRKIPEGSQAAAVMVGSVHSLTTPVLALVRLSSGCYFDNFLEVPLPVRFIFIALGPEHIDIDYKEIGRAFSTLLNNKDFRTVIYRADDRQEILSGINEFLDDSLVLPPGNLDKLGKELFPLSLIKNKLFAINERKETRIKAIAQRELSVANALAAKQPPRNPLVRTKIPFGGLINDIKYRYPWYWSDIRDGCGLVCVAATVFIFFAALSSAITFGGLLAAKTNNMIGVSETLIATCGAGVIFALLSGQPLIIVGTTGPLLLFDESLYNFCESQDIDFLTMRVWIGMWMGGIALIVVVFEGSLLVRLFTRFTQEIFASLIALLFIYESLFSLYKIYVDHPLKTYYDYCYTDEVLDDIQNFTTNRKSFSTEELRILILPNDDDKIPKNQPNTALMCTIIMFGTFLIAYILKQFRNSHFLGRMARRALGDFGVPISILIMVLIDYMTAETYTKKLNVPAGLSPTTPRDWILSPMNGVKTGVKSWVPFGAAVPAILVFILIFMETEICQLIINKKERRLMKGAGFHLDIFILCMLNIGCTFIGAPFMCAATIRSVAHVSALTVFSTTDAPGVTPKIIGVKVYIIVSTHVNMDRERRLSDDEIRRRLLESSDESEAEVVNGEVISDEEDNIEEDINIPDEFDASYEEDMPQQDILPHLPESESESEDTSDKMKVLACPFVMYGKDKYKWNGFQPAQHVRTPSRNIVIRLPGPKEPTRSVQSELESWSLFFSDDELQKIVTFTNAEIVTQQQNYCKTQRQQVEAIQLLSFTRNVELVELKALIGLYYLAGVLKVNHLLVN